MNILGITSFVNLWTLFSFVDYKLEIEPFSTSWNYGDRIITIYDQQRGL